MKRFVPIIAIVVLMLTAGVVLAYSAVQLDSPINNGTVKLNPVNFSWFSTSGAIKYTLKIRNLNNNAYTQYILTPGQVCGGGYCSYSIPKTLSNAKYRWLVTTKYTNGSTLDSAKRIFYKK